MTIAYFGTGLLGAGFVQHLLELGHTVNVWNRSPEKAAALEAHGAKAFTDPAAAVRGAEQLHLTLADDESVDAVLEPIADAIDASTIIVDHTTTAPTKTLERVKRWDGRGKQFVHAPVFMGPANSKNATGIMLISGARDRYDHLLPTLQTMTGNVVYLGEQPHHAAAYKLFGNLMLITIVSGLGDLNRLADSVGIDTAEAFKIFDFFKPAGFFERYSQKIASGDMARSFELSMARKDVRLMVEEAASHDVELGIMPAIGTMFDTVIAKGMGAEDYTITAKADALHKVDALAAS